MEDYKDPNDSQNPEALKRQAELINRTVSYTLERQAGVIEKFFPDKIATLKQQHMETLAKEQLDYNVNAIRIFKSNQLKSLEVFLRESLNRVIIGEGGESAQFANAVVREVTNSYSQTSKEITKMLAERIDEISSIKSDLLRQKAEQSLNIAIETLTDSLTNILADFTAKVDSVAPKRGK